MWPRPITLVTIWFMAGLAPAQDFVGFKTHDINPQAGTGLAITVADVNGDGKSDIVGASDKDVAWYQNPGWERRLISERIKGSNVCIAAQDLDGDKLPEFALGADWQFTNTKSGGSLYILRRKASLDESWEVKEIATEPTIHRIRWADLDGNGKAELIVAPLKGRDSTEPLFGESGVRLMRLRPPTSFMTDPWPMNVIDDSLHVLHNIFPVRLEGMKRDVLLTASFEGINQFRLDKDGKTIKQELDKGNPVPPSGSGAGEIKLGALGKGVRLLGTVEPWHGNQAVVYLKKDTPGAKPGQVLAGNWDRYVMDDKLAQGHAVGFADFDGDGFDDIMIGFREKAPPKDLPGLNVYKLQPSPEGKLIWQKQIVDDGGMATEDAIVADLNADGRPDIAAFGRATHNIKYYENLGKK